MPFFNPLKVSLAAAAGLAMVPVAGLAQTPAPGATIAADGPTYADLATLADAAELVARVQIRKATALKPDRAPGLQPGFARLYVQAQTLSLIGGRSSVGASVAYLVDVPLDAKGKVPKLNKREFLLFARGVPGRPGELQLIAPGAQLAYTPELEARLRPVLTEIYSDDAPPRITGVSDALAVRGTLTGESETQIFLATENRSPVSITVLRRPGQRPGDLPGGDLGRRRRRPADDRRLRRDRGGYGAGWRRASRHRPGSSDACPDCSSRRRAGWHAGTGCRLRYGNR